MARRWVIRGGKPKPTALKLLTGNPGKRRLNANEPKPRAGIPPCPKHLQGAARKEWRRITKVLEQMGLVTHADLAALSNYCLDFARVVKIEAIVQRDGEVLYETRVTKGKGKDAEATTETTRSYTNPYVTVLYKAKRSMLSFLSEFGLTPASRSRLDVPGPVRIMSPSTVARNRTPSG